MTGSFVFPRVQAIPQVGRVAFCVDGVEKAGYEFGEQTTRPFLFPLVGPSGSTLTRMGHPNPVGHEHHKSVWFGHQKVGGVNFWEEQPATDIRIRHRRVQILRDGHNWGGMAAELDWWGGGRAILTQQLTIAIEPTTDGGYALDLQSIFESPGGGPVELGQTHFGFLGVRVAKTMSEQFGGGHLTDSHGSRGEAAIFSKQGPWVDYSGPIAPGKVEGICFMDHPSNPNHPVRWHVRRDGWMGAAFNHDAPYGVARDHALSLRYRLLVHSGPAVIEALNSEWASFADLPAYVIVPARANEPTGLYRAVRTL
jgi:Methane oxygenase PmoA